MLTNTLYIIIANVLCTILIYSAVSAGIPYMHAYSGELSVSVVVVLHSLWSTSPLLDALMVALLNFMW